MALPATTVWEVRTDGNNANGGGFITGSSGTDYSQQAAAQVAYTDMVIDGATNTKFTSAANPVTAAHVGNVVNVTGGVGFTVQRVYIVSQAAGVATCDTSLGTLGSTGGTGNLGGALLTIAQALTLSTVDNMQTYVRGGTYTITTALSLPSRTGQYRTRLVGYSTVRGDNGRPIISVTAAVNGITGAGGWSVENFDIDGTSTGLSGVLLSVSFSAWWNCKIHDFTAWGVSISTNNHGFVNCEITGCVSGGFSAENINNVFVMGSWIHNNTGPGVIMSVVGGCSNNVISNNSGATSDGIRLEYVGEAVGNVIYGNGRDGIRAAQNFSFNIAAIRCQNNILVNNAGYGINQPTAQTHADVPWIDYNAFYNNTSGARNNINASPHDVTLTADPFVNAAGNDFSLNNVAGGGAACRNAGFPGALPGLASPLGYADIGVYRHKDPTGAGRGFRRGMG